MILVEGNLHFYIILKENLFLDAQCHCISCDLIYLNRPNFWFNEESTDFFMICCRKFICFRSTRQFTQRMHRIQSLNIYSFDASKLLILVQTRITKQSFSMHHSRYCVYNNDCRATSVLFYYSAMQVMFYKWLYLNGFLTNVSVLSGKNFILPPPLTEHEKTFSQVLH